MHRRHNADQEVEADGLALLYAAADGFAADARHTDLTVGLVGEPVVDVVRQLAVNADRLNLVHDGVARSFEHVSRAPRARG